ncbi:hypothetical protein Avbf_03246 [Armadillidium vulgare]|nr:hypothetical protein Avbf_03246 [Armadillidium vulgare]
MWVHNQKYLYIRVMSFPDVILVKRVVMFEEIHMKCITHALALSTTCAHSKIPSRPLQTKFKS